MQVEPDPDFSRCLTLTGPDSGKEFTDFSRVALSITTKQGQTVKLQIDRCGDAGGSGNSIAIVSKDGEEVARTETPEPELKKTTEAQAAADPEMMPYFFLQSDDYVTLKERSTAHILSGAPGAPEGMATIDVAVEALKCAEYLTPMLQEALKK